VTHIGATLRQETEFEASKVTWDVISRIFLLLFLVYLYIGVLPSFQTTNQPVLDVTNQSLYCKDASYRQSRL